MHTINNPDSRHATFYQKVASLRLKLRNRHFFFMDLALLAGAAYLSFVLRFDELSIEPRYQPGFILFLILVLLFIPMSFRQAGVYRRYWRFASVEELVLLTGAVTAPTTIIGGLAFAVNWWSQGGHLIPRSIPFIFLLLALVATAAPRLAVRLMIPFRRQLKRGADQMIPVLVMGAGDAGRMIVRELYQNPQLGLDVVGLLDDDETKHGMRIHNIPVIGARTDIPRLVHQLNVARVIIAMPAAPGKILREIVQICEQAGVPAQTMPGIYELLGGRISVSQLRNVEIEDLLRREPVRTDHAAIAEVVKGKRVLVTGGGGSIGSELCRQILSCQPAELIVLGHGENSVFEIQNQLQSMITKGTAGNISCKIEGVIADIRFPERIQAIFAQRRPHIVFHAAAHKHVPLMELNPAEAVTNNILGTRNVVNAALESNVERFVMISSDKAVNPTNVMGASKRAAELIVHKAAKQSGRPFVAVRFGNVLGSRGSVVLSFRQQIAAGGPVQVTHPEMRRYFMTIPEAVALVLQAAVFGRGGEVFVLDMGEPIRIADLARDMIELSGLEVGRDIDIVFTNIRPGEKLFEELFVAGEAYERTKHSRIFIAGNASSFIPPNLEDAVKELAIAASRSDAIAIRRGLQNLVPEYRPANMPSAEVPASSAEEAVTFRVLGAPVTSH
jgi:FlaA1/EpsC-like NDP-sugar epimerase